MRFLRRWGYLAALRWAWEHRGTLVRLIDAAGRLPSRARTERLRDSVTELRAIVELDRDRDLARRTDVRIGAVGDGSATLLAPTDAEAERARRTLLGVHGVVDVRATDPDEPVLTGAENSQ
jgi:hypothetical protein